MGRGLFAAILDYVLKIQQTVAEQLALHAIGPGALAWLSMDHAPMGSTTITTGDLVNQMATSYLAAGLDALSNGIEDEAVATVTSSMSIDTLAVTFSSLALLVIYVLVYQPLMRVPHTPPNPPASHARPPPPAHPSTLSRWRPSRPAHAPTLAPHSAFLDIEIKRSRYLLLLIPEEIAKVVPAVVQASQRLAIYAQENS